MYSYDHIILNINGGLGLYISIIVDQIVSILAPSFLLLSFSGLETAARRPTVFTVTFSRLASALKQYEMFIPCSRQHLLYRPLNDFPMLWLYDKEIIPL
jgi:hypothetical protein